MRSIVFVSCMMRDVKVVNIVNEFIFLYLVIEIIEVEVDN